MFDGFADWLLQVAGRAVGQVVGELLATLESTTRVSFTSGWWTEAQSQDVVGMIGGLAAALLVICLVAALVQGLLAGQPAMVLRAVAVEAPVSVFMMVVLAAGATLLLQFTDAASAEVFGGDGAVAQALTTIATPAMGSSALSGILLALFGVGAFLVWLELVVREALIYMVVAVAPLVLAARVWPAMQPAWRKLVDVGVALILSKFFIALALRLGAAAVNTGSTDGIELPGLLTGSSLMLIAAFMPFTLMRLLDVMGAAAVAQGISGAPARAVREGIQLGYYARGLHALARGGTPAAAGAGAGAGGPGGGPGELGGGPRPAGLGPGPGPGGGLGPGSRPSGVGSGSRRGGALGPGPRGVGPGARGIGRARGIGPGPRSIEPGPRGIGPGPRAVGPGPRAVGPGSGSTEGATPGPGGSAPPPDGPRGVAPPPGGPSSGRPQPGAARGGRPRSGPAAGGVTVRPGRAAVRPIGALPASVRPAAAPPPLRVVDLPSVRRTT